MRKLLAPIGAYLILFAALGAWRMTAKAPQPLPAHSAATPAPKTALAPILERHGANPAPVATQALPWSRPVTEQERKGRFSL